jgi:carbonic anhydrase
VANVCRTTILRRAWYRGYRIEVQGLIYGLRDGLLRQLGPSVKDGLSWRERYNASLQALERRASG